MTGRDPDSDKTTAVALTGLLAVVVVALSILTLAGFWIVPIFVMYLLVSSAGVGLALLGVAVNGWFASRRYPGGKHAPLIVAVVLLLYIMLTSLSPTRPFFPGWLLLPTLHPKAHLLQVLVLGIAFGLALTTFRRA